jgi:mono/diheme cytochrome c family protein
MEKAVVGLVIGIALAGFLWKTDVFGDEVTQGKSIFENKCQLCHGVSGKGDGPAAAAMDPRPANFTNPEFWQGNVEQKITETVRRGKPPMPAFDLTDQEIKAVIDYMRHAFGKVVSEQ